LVSGWLVLFAVTACRACDKPCTTPHFGALQPPRSPESTLSCFHGAGPITVHARDSPMGPGMSRAAHHRTAQLRCRRRGAGEPAAITAVAPHRDQLEPCHGGHSSALGSCTTTGPARSRPVLRVGLGGAVGHQRALPARHRGLECPTWSAEHQPVPAQPATGTQKVPPGRPPI
jgi:hypothetical protein